MKYVSLFSGIEAASVAWEPLGWEPLAFSEIDAFPCAVLAERFPGVPNLGDITKIDWKKAVKAYGKPDIVVGGSPCQSFSVAGGRTGLDGASGLMWEYVRAVRDIRPRWILWENVPGALSSSHGEDFRCLLEALDARGYGLAWRVLDAQFFGVAQRRERVFLVGRLGDPDGPCRVLFEPESLRWDSPSSKDKRKALAAGAGIGPKTAGWPVSAWFSYKASPSAGSIGYEPEQAPTVLAERNDAAVCIQGDIARGAHMGQNEKGWSDDGSCYTLDTMDVPAVLDLTGGEAQASRVYSSDGIAPSLRAHESGGNDLKVLCMAGQMPNAMVSDEVCGTLTAHEARVVNRMREEIAFSANQRGEVRLQGGDGEVCGDITASRSGKQVQGVVCQYGEVAGALTARGDSSPCSDRGPSVVSDGYAVRRLTPRECERLQGFQDDWTKIPYRGKPAEECPDTPRYKAIGNSMAVPVMRWIGERIELAERGV